MLDKRAFLNCKIETINAPKVTRIEQEAFSKCPSLRKVILGTLDYVYGAANSNDGIFYYTNTDRINLYLHESQKVMTFNSNYNIWEPSGEKYLDSDEFNVGEFLGYQFRSVRSWK